MSDYEDDLDILTSLMDDEDDEEEKLRKKIKSKSPSSPAFKKRYTNNPGSSQSQSAGSNPGTSQSAGSNSGTSKNAGSSQRDDKQSGSRKTKQVVESSTQSKETHKEEVPQSSQDSIPDFDNDEDIDDLAALLEAEEAEEMTSQQALSSSTPSTSQKSNKPAKVKKEPVKVEVEDNSENDRKASSGKSDEEKSKQELLEELQRMKAAMEKMKTGGQSSTEKPTTSAIKKETKSPQREMFSDAITPKIGKKPTKGSKGKATQSQQKSGGKTTGNQHSPDSMSDSAGEGRQQKKKKYTMNAAAATALFHSSNSDDDQDMESSSSDSDEETVMDKFLKQSNSPPAPSKVDMFTKHKRRVAHTPNNHQIKPKKETPYQCRQCKKTFPDSYKFEVHKYNHRSNPSHDCKFCKLNFPSRPQLVTHLRDHGDPGAEEIKKLNEATKMLLYDKSPEERKKETKLIDCKFCVRTFTRKPEYHSHLRAHGEKGSAELNRIRSSTGEPTSSSSTAGSSSSSAGYRNDITSNYSNSKKMPGAKLLGDQRRHRDEKTGEIFEVERFSQIRIINPVISSTSMTEKMQGRKFIRMPVIKSYLKGEKKDVEGDWATMGVIISKVPPKTSSNGKTFSIWKLNDLNHIQSTVAFFLFGKVHDEHWKTVEGSVVGILNANIMPNRDHGQPDELAMTIDHPQKMLVMGKSKDFGICKGKRKNGGQCPNVVNKTACEFCEYHVQAEYKKQSAKRADLQSSYGGVVPKNMGSKSMQSLKGQYFHGGKSYNIDPSKNVKATAQKKKATGLGSGKGVDKMLDQVRKDVVLMHGRGKNEKDTVVELAGASKNFKELLSQPTPGTQNLMRHMVTVESNSKPQMQLLSAKELLIKQKRDEQRRRAIQQSKQPSLGRGFGKSNTPQLGSSLDNDDEFNFYSGGGISKSSRAPSTSGSIGSQTAEIAKRKALAMLKTKGPLTKQDPNCVGRNKEKSEKKQEVIRKRVEKDRNIGTSGESSPENIKEEQPVRKKRRLYLDDGKEMSKEELTAIMNAKSINEEQLQEIEAEWQDQYFTQLEKKEKLENKMAGVTQRKCKVVSCKQCKYTWFAPSSLCVKQKHILSRHDAMERFFVCNGCRVRTVAFDRIPTRPCRCCGSTDFERTSMLKERKGPKLESEKLLIRGEERKYVSSL